MLIQALAYQLALSSTQRVATVLVAAAVGLAATRYLAEAPPPAPDEASEDEDYGY